MNLDVEDDAEARKSEGKHSKKEKDPIKTEELRKKSGRWKRKEGKGRRRRKQLKHLQH